MMLKAIHAQENKHVAREKVRQVMENLKEKKLGSATKNLQDVIEETFTYMDFPIQYWSWIQTQHHQIAQP
ncbi:MAG: hypothetical protein HDR13_16355 [Lachnospiraceae bacterium]|nr:hypothetical protein [Lachnospiraceae bacterium]